MTTEQEASLRKRAEAGGVRAMYELGQASTDLKEKDCWLRRASNAHFIPAMCDWGLRCDDPDERKHCFREAAEEGNIAAMHYFAGGPDSFAIGVPKA